MSKIINKIRALLAKTMASGCTEHEALAAAQAAQRLMLEHDLTAADIAEREEFVTRDVRTPVARGLEDFLAPSIARFFDCCPIKSTRVDGYAGRRRRCSVMHFFGRQADVIMAEWLFKMLVQTAKREWKEHAKTICCGAIRSDRNGFDVAYAHRIDQRLRAMKDETKVEMPISHAMAVVKTQKARDEAFALAFPKAQKVRHRDRSMSPASIEAGLAAGDAANLSRPVGASAETRMLAIRASIANAEPSR